MKKYLVLATLFLLSSYAQAANVTWYGSAGWRYGSASQKDGTSTNGTAGTVTASTNNRTEKDYMIRGELGATGGWDNVEWGTAVRTNGSSRITMPNDNGTGVVRNSDWTAVGSSKGGATDLGLGFSKAWFKYGNVWGFGDIGFIFGRQAPAFVTGKNQLFIDKDVNFDGMAQTWHWGSFGLNLSEYVLGGVNGGAQSSSDVTSTDFSSNQPTTPSGLAYLFSVQPTFKWKFTDEINALFAVGYHKWTNTVGSAYQNLIPNGGLSTAGFGTTAATSIANGTTFATRVSQENSAQWQFLTSWNLPYMLAFDFEYIMNKDLFYQPVAAPGGNSNLGGTKQDKSAWSAGLSYGSLKKAHDFTIAYSYHNKGLGAVLTAFTDDVIQAGMQGHEINVAYNIANNFSFGANAYFLQEKTTKNNLGNDVSPAKIKTNYWELTTGVRF